ncbi:hypothetical protein HPB47_022617, partial [Ixodes persulcatus]
MSRLVPGSELTALPRKICAKHCDFTVYCDCTAYDSLGVLQLFALELPESRIVFLLIFALQAFGPREGEKSPRSFTTPFLHSK